MREEKRRKVETFKELLINADVQSNYHTHTLYCDGKDSPQALAEKAYELGFSELGFSGHEWSIYDEHYAMDKANFEKYIDDIDKLKLEYEGKMNIYTGIERDYYSQPSPYEFDYVIGSVHHVVYGGEELPVDESEDSFVEMNDKVFGGDFMGFVRAYYATVKDVLNKTGASIVGHFDLITKFNEGNKYFDEDSREYRDIVVDAIDGIIGSYEADKNKAAYPNMPPDLKAGLERGLPIFEINTGAMARGYRQEPYPSKFIVEELMKREVPLLFGSDCHDREYLAFGKEKLADILF